MYGGGNGLLEAAGDVKFGEVVVQVDGACGLELVANAGVLLHGEGVIVRELDFELPFHCEIKANELAFDVKK